MSDELGGLAAAARAGDGGAREELARRLVGAGYALSLSRLGNTADAEDLAQECAVRALRALGTVREPARFGAFFGVLVRNACFDLARRRHARPVARPLPGVEPLDPRARDPASAAAEEDEAARALRALASLPAEERDAVALEILEGRNHPEAAALLGWSIGKVRRRLNAGLRRLRHALAAREALP